MNNLPNEVIRMIFEHFSRQQRKGISRVSKTWFYLVLTFLKYPIRYFYENCNKNQISFSDFGPTTSTPRSNFICARKKIIISNDGFVFGLEYDFCKELLSSATNNKKIVVADEEQIYVFDNKGIFLNKFNPFGKLQTVTYRIAIDYQTDHIIVVSTIIKVFDCHGLFLFRLGIVVPAFSYNNYNVIINHKNRNIVIVYDTINTVVVFHYNDDNYSTMQYNHHSTFRYGENISPRKIYITNDDLIIISDRTNILMFTFQGITICKINFLEITSQSNTLMGITCLSDDTLLCATHNRLYILKPDYDKDDHTSTKN